MCTAVTYKTKDHYFGRNLDYEVSYGSEIVITPRAFPFAFRHVDSMRTHYAIIGMAAVAEGYPLYFDGTNEAGLSMAGLNFLGNADFKKVQKGMSNIATFEFIPWVLGQCASVDEVKVLCERLNLTDESFSAQYPPAALHWMIADREGAIVVEAVKEGVKIYDNPVGVLTNNPPFPMQMFNLNNYRHISIGTPENTFTKTMPLTIYSRGMGGLGLPGDLSSQSRFVKAVFTKMNAVSGESESESISQFFHILGAVSQQRGCCEVEPGIFEFTIYSSCVNTDKGIYYYTTYENSQISGVNLHLENLAGDELVIYPLRTGQQIFMENE